MKYRLSKSFLLSAVLFLVLMLTAFLLPPRMPKPQEIEARKALVMVNDQKIEAAIALTAVEKEKGLSGTSALAEGDGLLFVFESDDYYGIWMKGMLIPIDIAWLDEGGFIVDLEHSVSPDTFPTIFRPAAEARYVLETNAGWFKAHEINVGDHVFLKNLP
ncbi:MAG: DUF192 domain-containing protein [bacterium]|nr:DUF192 domain-containing protein [bacterium]